MRHGAAVFAALAFGSLAFVSAQDSQPASAPATNPALARQFLSAGRDAMRKAKPTDAAEALRRALRNDPSVLEGYYLLGKAYQALGRTQDATEMYKTLLKRMAGRNDLPAEAGAWRRHAAAQIDRLCVFPKQWATLSAAYAKRFRNTAAGQGGMVSCVRALTIAAALTPADAKVAEELKVARGLLPKALPAAPAKPDEVGANLLVDKAGRELRSGKPAKAVETLRQAAGMWRHPQVLAPLAEAYLACKRPADAAVVVAAAEPLIKDLEVKFQGAYRGRLLKARRRADPAATRVAALTLQWAGQAERLAARAIAGKDYDIADEAVCLVLRFLPGRQSAMKLRDKITGAGPTCRSLPNLTSKWVKVYHNGPAARQVNVTARTVELLCATDEKDTSAMIRLTLTPLVWGKSIRSTWRLRQIAPPPAKGDKGYPSLLALPIKYEFRIDNAGKKAWSLVLSSAPFKSTTLCAKGVPEKMYRPDGVYDIAFVKDGAKIAVKVNDEFLFRAELTAKHAQAVAKQPFFFDVAWRYGAKQKVHLKATLLEFSCSQDCIVQGKGQ